MTNIAHFLHRNLRCQCPIIAFWRTVVERNLDFAIVLEDDVAPQPGFRSFVNALVRALPAKYDLVHLFVSIDKDYYVDGMELFNHQNWAERASGSKTPYVEFVPIWGRSAYVISKAGAKRLLQCFKTIKRHGDMQIAELAKSGQLTACCASEIHIDNLGQVLARSQGAVFSSNVERF